MVRVLVIDFMALFARSYHGLIKTGMLNSQGIGTWAIFGFIKALLENVNSFQPQFVVCAEEGGSSFRKTWSQDYKAGRGKQETEFFNQKNILLTALEEVGIPILRVSGYEADDLIYSLTKNTFAYQGLNRDEAYVLENPVEELKIRVLTVDQDLLALVKPNCEVLVWKSNKTECLYQTDEDVLKGYGFLPHQITDMKALTGDKSDNISGVKGFGEVAAKKFFTFYSSLKEAHLDNFSKLTPRHQTLLLDNISSIEQSYSLAKMYDIPNSALILYEMVRREPNIFIDVLEFRSLASQLRYPSWTPVTFKYGFKPTSSSSTAATPAVSP